MFPKILFTAVPQPHPQLLRNLVFLFLSQGVVQGQSLFPFAPAGPIVVGIPIAAGGPNAAAHFFDEGFPFEGLIRGRHDDDVMDWSYLSLWQGDRLS
jgi:hypothetical protein